MKEILLDTLIDGLKLLPFLFVAFLIIELIEHKMNKKNIKLISKQKKFGPLIGSLLGVIPQCGFSVMATNLYITRIITLGTLISIYLSTSDEMLPILIASDVDKIIIFKILITKVIIAIIMGFIIDLLFRNKNKESINYNMCDELNCHCEDGMIISTIKHTVHILLFIMGISLLINILFYYIDPNNISNIFLKNKLLGPFISSLVGLIPNCGASVIITELYINNVIPFSSLIAGLLTGSGVALLVLFKSNKNIKENLKILLLVYTIGVLSGVIIELLV